MLGQGRRARIPCEAYLTCVLDLRVRWDPCMVWYGHGMAWYGMVWYGMVELCGPMQWHQTTICRSPVPICVVIETK